MYAAPLLLPSFILLILLTFTDKITTFLGVTLGLQESNILIILLMDAYGVTGALLVSFAINLWGAYMLYKRKHLVLLTTANLFYGGLLVLNLQRIRAL